MPQQELAIALLLRSEVPPKKTISVAQEAEDYGVDYRALDNCSVFSRPSRSLDSGAVAA